ncbi:MAG: hypothetical protein ABEK03_04425 [Candidatus Bipolaricaulia bacterium]
MRKGLLAVGLIALILTASGTPLVLSQMQSPSEETESQTSREADSDQLELEIVMLRAINDMDLDADQLETLHGIVADLKSSRARVNEAQRSLHTFLVEFEGSREAYRDAVQDHERELRQARSEFRQALHNAIDRVKATLTIQQGEILERHLTRQLGSATGPLDVRAQKADPNGGPPGECLTSRLNDSVDRLRKRVGEMLDRFGLDGETLESWKREFQNQLTCPPMPDQGPNSGDRERSRLQLELNVDRIRGLMMDHLDALERVLDKKLSVLRGAQASAPATTPNKRRSSFRPS